VAAFWTGFLFIFCLQVLLFLVLDLAIEIGATSNQAEADWGAALGVIFSIIPFVYGLASALVIAGAFIKDTWSGHVLVRSFTLRGWSDVVVEWIFFAFFLGLPLLLMGVMLLAKSDIWWQVTSLFWLSSVIFFFVLFTANVIFYEMRACWEITRNWREDDIDSYWELIKKSVLLRQMSAYSGRQTISYLSMGSIIDAEYTDKSKSERNMVAETQAVSLSWRAKLTNWDFLERLGLYEKIETAERIYTVDDARDIRPFVTSQSWSLEKIFCRPKDSRYIAIVKGPGALSRMQMRSSLVCSLIGNFLIFLLILALLTWLELGGVFTCLILAVGVIVALPGLKSSYKLFKITKQLVLATSDADERTTREDYQGETTSASEGVYLVVENYRVSRATPRLCCMMLAIEIGLFFVWPLISLFGVGNYPLGIFFIIVTGFTGMRYYVNAAVVLEETGRMDLVDGDTEKELWKNESRLNSIVGDITRGRSRSAWISILGFFGFTFVALFLGAIGQQEEDTAVKPYAYLPDFVYEQKDSLRYPSCELTSDLGESPLTAIADYAFLAGLAYRDVNGTQAALDGWFGPSGQNATDRNAIVEDWRDVNDIQSAVSFKLVTFPDNGNFAYVLIRGTQNNWDMLTDVQLWGAAALMQTLRLLLPVGEIWTPIIAQLIQVITKLESKSIDRVSFYKVTSQFVRFLKEQTTYLGVGITGHSLGGGLVRSILMMRQYLKAALIPRTHLLLVPNLPRRRSLRVHRLALPPLLSQAPTPCCHGSRLILPFRVTTWIARPSTLFRLATLCQCWTTWLRTFKRFGAKPARTTLLDVTIRHDRCARLCLPAAVRCVLHYVNVCALTATTNPNKLTWKAEHLTKLVRKQ
jgi:lipase ATG15